MKRFYHISSQNQTLLFLSCLIWLLHGKFTAAVILAVKSIQFRQLYRTFISVFLLKIRQKIFDAVLPGKPYAVLCHNVPP